MIFESLGGVASEAEGVLRSLNKAVAEHTDTPAWEVATLFWHRVGVDIQRAAHRAFSRRVVKCLEWGAGGLGNAYYADGVLEMAEGL